MARILTKDEAVRSSKYSYLIEEHVGSGGQAHGYRVLCSEIKAGPIFLKQYHEQPFVPRRDVGRKAFRMQSELVERLQAFTFVQKIHEFFEFESCYYQSGAWEEGQGLADVIRDFESYTFRDRKLHAMTLCYAVKVLHEEQKIAHQDLSKFNVRVVKGGGRGDQIHLTDFDNATIDECEPVVIAGTPDYIAPEKIDPGRVGFSGNVGFASDVFSLSCLIFEIFFGVLPWHARDKENPLLLMTSLENAYHPAQLSRYCGAEGSENGRALGDLIWRGLSPNASDRPTAGELHGVLAMMDIDDDEDYPKADPEAPNLPIPGELGPAPDRKPHKKETSADDRVDLVLRCGDKRLVIAGSELIGRGQLRGLPEHQTVSRKHARFFFVDGAGWFVSHIGRNPTFVDGVQVPELSRQLLKKGAKIMLGALELSVEDA